MHRYHHRQINTSRDQVFVLGRNISRMKVHDHWVDGNLPESWLNGDGIFLWMKGLQPKVISTRKLSHYLLDQFTSHHQALYPQSTKSPHQTKPTPIIMQFTLLALAAGASVAVAQVNPALCGGRTPQCCNLNVLDVASITCENRTHSISVDGCS